MRASSLANRCRRRRALSRFTALRFSGSTYGIRSTINQGSTNRLRRRAPRAGGGDCAGGGLVIKRPPFSCLATVVAARAGWDEIGYVVAAAERDRLEMICGSGWLAAPVTGRMVSQEGGSVPPIFGGLSRETRWRACEDPVICAVSISWCAGDEGPTARLAGVIRHQRSRARTTPIALRIARPIGFSGPFEYED